MNVIFETNANVMVKFINKANSNCVNQHLPIYDASLWTYPIFLKNQCFGKGYVFAVKIHHKNKTIECLGGIEWGFELHLINLFPTLFEPKLLNNTNLENIWNFIKNTLPEYRQIP